MTRGTPRVTATVLHWRRAPDGAYGARFSTQSRYVNAHRAMERCRHGCRHVARVFDEATATCSLWFHELMMCGRRRRTLSCTSCGTEVSPCSTVHGAGALAELKCASAVTLHAIAVTFHATLFLRRLDGPAARIRCRTAQCDAEFRRSLEASAHAFSCAAPGAGVNQLSDAAALGCPEAMLGDGCSRMSKCFKNDPVELYRHLLVHHILAPGAFVKAADPDSVTCPFCQLSFSSIDNYKFHLVNATCSSTRLIG